MFLPSSKYYILLIFSTAENKVDPQRGKKCSTYQKEKKNVRCQWCVATTKRVGYPWYFGRACGMREEVQMLHAKEDREKDLIEIFRYRQPLRIPNSCHISASKNVRYSLVSPSYHNWYFWKDEFCYGTLEKRIIGQIMPLDREFAKTHHKFMAICPDTPHRLYFNHFLYFLFQIKLHTTTLPLYNWK
jgi:hypothetical protein